jgi:hypothetical protein
VVLAVAVLWILGAADSARSAERVARLSPCFDARDVELCIRFAADEDDRRQSEALAIEQRDCQRRLTSSEGKGVFACSSDRAGEDPDPERGTVLGRELRAAVARGERAEAESIYSQILSFSWEVGAKECTAACNAEGRSMLRLAHEGASLVHGYEVCIAKSESSPEARRLRTTDPDGYRMIARSAVDRCRKAHDCDAIERYGVGVCRARAASPIR